MVQIFNNSLFHRNCQERERKGTHSIKGMLHLHVKMANRFSSLFFQSLSPISCNKYIIEAKHVFSAVNPKDLLILYHALKKTANQGFWCVPLVIMNETAQSHHVVPDKSLAGSMCKVISIQLSSNFERIFKFEWWTELFSRVLSFYVLKLWTKLLLKRKPSGKTQEIVSQWMNNQNNSKAQLNWAELKVHLWSFSKRAGKKNNFGPLGLTFSPKSGSLSALPRSTPKLIKCYVIVFSRFALHLHYLFFMPHVWKEIFLKWFQSSFQPVLKSIPVQISPAFWSTLKSFLCQGQNFQNMIVFVNVTHNSLNLFINQAMLKNCHNTSVFNFFMMFEFLESRVDTPQKSHKGHIIFEVCGW